MGKPQSTGNLVNALAQDSSNNIGIGGAANASFKLQVTGATNLTGALTGTSGNFSGDLTIDTNTLFVDSTNNRVGIGTTTPATRFELAGGSGNFQIASSGAEVFFTRDGNNDILANAGTSAGIRFGGQQQLRFATGSSLTTRLTIDSTGAATFQTTGNNGIINIGGTTFYSQLETNSTLGGLKIKSIWGATNSGIIQFINGTAENVRMHIADNGFIGIGTITPSSNLQVHGTSFCEVRSLSTTTGDYANFIVDTNNNTNYRLQIVGFGTTASGDLAGISRAGNGFLVKSGGLLAVGTRDSNALVFSTNETERMRIYSNGRIENSNVPANDFALTINGSSTTSQSYGINIYAGTNSSDASLNVNSRSGSSYFKVRGDGKIEMGNTAISGEILKITGNSGLDNYISVYSGSIHMFVDADASNSAGIVGTQSSHNLKLRTGGINRMNIDTSGNIGAPNSGSNIYSASDLRLKQNIETIENGLDKIIALNPVKFNWIDGFVESEDGKDMLGFIAQEVQNAIPEAVEDFSSNSITIGEKTIENPLRVNEKFIIPVLVKAIQELTQKVNALENK